MSTHEELTPVVTSVIEGADPKDLLAALKAMGREDVYGQAIVRYMLSQSAWDFTPGNEHDEVLQHLFGHFEGRTEFTSADYLKATHHIIITRWGFDIPSPTYDKPVAAAPKKPKAEKPVEKPVTAKRKGKALVVESTDDSVSGSKKFGSLSQADTNLASKRLQKVINIQRGG